MENKYYAIIFGIAAAGIIGYYLLSKTNVQSSTAQSSKPKLLEPGSGYGTSCVTILGPYTNVPCNVADKGWISYNGTKCAIITDIEGNQFSVFKVDINGKTYYSLMQNNGIWVNKKYPITNYAYFNLYPSIQALANGSNIIIKRVTKVS
ncbi:MAG: hypothetical protein QXU98_12550 [Candidatus Parvarchaeota archaeon]